MNFMENLTDKNKNELSEFIRTTSILEEIKRAQGILLIAQKFSEELIFELTGLKRASLIKLRKQYLKKGISVLENKRKNKKTRSLLTKLERNQIMEMLYTKTPRNYGWGWDYWTPTILSKLILELYGVQYKSKTSIYIIFKQSKFTYHKPEKIYAKYDPELVNAWKNANETIVKEALNDSRTVILVADEMILTSQTTTQKIWLPEGHYPEIQCSNTRKRRSIYGFLNIKTGEEFAFKAEAQNSEISAKILKKILAKYTKNNVLLFWDNAPWHKGASMRDFLSTCSNLTIVNFPPYSPDENPQEHVWKAGRAQVTHNTFIADIDSAVRELLTYLNNSIFKYEFFGFTA